MRPNRLNLSALRGNRLPGLQEAELTSQQLLRSPGAAGLSRREVLRLAGTAAAVAGIAPALRAARGVDPGPFELKGDRRRIAFWLGGRERWVIDTRRFSGSPELRVDQGEHAIRVELLGARYPGTDLPADLVCDLRSGATGWVMNLRLAFGGFAAGVPFARWLTGAEAARSRVNVDGPLCPLGAASGVGWAGGARAEYFPDWTLRLYGDQIGRLAGLGDELAADILTIALLDPDRPSLMQYPAARRTLISLARGEQAWSLPPGLGAVAGGALVAQGSPFAAIHVEAGESRAGLVRRALVAQAGAAGGQVAYQPEGRLTGAGGGPFQLPLAEPRYAVAFDPAGDQVALVARFDPDPVWVHARGVSLQVGEAPGAQSFTATGLNGNLDEVCCTPALLAVAAPLAGAVVQAAQVAPGTAIAFGGGVAQRDDRLQVPAVTTFVRIPLNFAVPVVRPEDLLALTFEFLNMNLEAGSGASPQLTLADGTKPAYLIVHFPPQHITEQAFREGETPGSATDEKPTAPPVRARMAGPSRLVFTIPAGSKAIPYTLESLLSWSKFEQSVAPTALPPSVPVSLTPSTGPVMTVSPTLPGTGTTVPAPTLVAAKPVPAQPRAQQTAIELPYRLILSPNRYAAWAHSAAPVTRGKHTELWHTRLGVRTKDPAVVDEARKDYRTVRAIWSPDYVPAPGAPPPDSEWPFTTTLNPNDRHQIVRLTADYAIANYEPVPVEVERLMLTALGAWLSSRGAWKPPAGILSVEEWRHQATMGRDHYVKVVRKGFLFPFGHLAALIKVTERKFQPTPGGSTAAYLRQREFIVVREPEKVYTAGAMPFKYGAREMPFRRLGITSLVTPNLDPIGGGIAGQGKKAFWPQVSKKDFQFTLVGVDADGQRAEFTAPLIFVDNIAAFTEATMKAVVDDYAKGDVNRRKRPFYGQKIAFAESGGSGETTLETASITFGGAVPQGKVPAGMVLFYPQVAGAEVRILAVSQLTGSTAPAGVVLHPAYLASGFAAAGNKGQVFVRLTTPLAAKFPADKSGGVVTPNMDVAGVSRAFGTVGGDADQLAAGTFDPTKYFNDQAKVLGGLPLKHLVKKVAPSDLTAASKKAPVITTKLIYTSGAPPAPPQAIETQFTWRPDVQSYPATKPIFIANSATKLEIDGKLVTSLEGKEPTYEIKGVIENFTLELIPQVVSFIRVKFKKFKFTMKSGDGLDVDPAVDSVDFLGPLEWVKTLKDYLKLGGGSSGGGGGGSGISKGMGLDVTTSDVTAGYSVKIPSVVVGALNIQNIVLGAYLNIPFDGTAVRLKFNFCARENPFLLTVSMFGGGGFFALILTMDGVEKLEAAFEFGGSFALNLGVASGGVYVMAGIYYKLEENKAQLTGYLRMGGSLEVLGIITVSVTFNMGLTYEPSTKKVWGQAKLTVEIEILFFSTSVSLKVERKFAGGNEDPSFAELMTPADWDSYCESYA